ncbi:MAG: bifunctional nicotinamidase/pyrazinamidase [Candidatus Marinimicrobia bacterium]|nr:bifunctional nicotinamidase/pyrazinamidase [Candidatus Neomarinimicrobiota bacterium]MCF7830023.1 bifunctional nicotinamidase/pyrazinamidase [Candidatus Neomarinimicrobiota bacterium]MCF7881935.1 bifunctional nicotinamidase/pyrazinamidase [Candidatus Neomarinimicrobiota bacterium]
MKLKDVQHLDEVQVKNGDALIVVDMQNDFMPGGALAVEDGDSIIPGVNKLMEKFNSKNLPIVFTQDWHTENHRSFASAHEGKEPFDPYEEPGIGPVLWPDHCVQGSEGADFHPNVNTTLPDAIVRKGYNKNRDSYSGFVENDHETETGLDGYLSNRKIKRIFICGLAMDYCAFFTAKDGADKGYEVFYLSDLTLPVGSPEDSVSNALETMKAKGVKFVKSKDVKFKDPHTVKAA